MAALEGPARKIVLPFIGLTGIGWFLFVIGFGIGTGGGPAVGSSALFPFWMISLLGLPLLGLAVGHAVVPHPIVSKILKVIITFFSVVYLLSLGMILFFIGGSIEAANQQGYYAITASAGLMFSGSLISSLFWMLHLMMWPFYQEPDRSFAYSGTQQNS